MFHSILGTFSLATVFVIGAVVIVLLLLHIKKLNSHLIDLTKENKQEPIDEEKNHINPLGKLFSHSTRTMTLTIQKNGKISEVNENLLKLLGYTKKQLLGKEIYGLLMPKISAREQLEMNIIKRIFENPKLYTEHETEFLTNKGTKVWISWTNRIVTDNRGKQKELRSIGFDITSRKKLEEQLHFIASKDPQTGTLNKLALLEIGTRELKRSIRYKHDFSILALRLISLNKNSSSDEVENQLKQVVSTCRHTIRDVDYLGRVGEAEFILLLPETQIKNVPFLQKRLQEKVEDYNQKSPSHPLQISFGTSAYTPKTKSIDELISQALANIKKGKIT